MLLELWVEHEERMEATLAKEEEWVRGSVAYARAKLGLGDTPAKGNVEELTFSFAFIDPGGQTDYQVHDRPELIYVVSGRGIAICEG